MKAEIAPPYRPVRNELCVRRRGYPCASSHRVRWDENGWQLGMGSHRGATGSTVMLHNTASAIYIRMRVAGQGPLPRRNASPSPRRPGGSRPRSTCRLGSFRVGGGSFRYQRDEVFPSSFFPVNIVVFSPVNIFDWPILKIIILCNSHVYIYCNITGEFTYILDIF